MLVWIVPGEMKQQSDEECCEREYAGITDYADIADLHISKCDTSKAKKREHATRDQKIPNPQGERASTEYRCRKQHRQ